MGLGKTPQTLAFIQSKLQANGHRPTLVVCPMSVWVNCRRGCTLYACLPVMVHHGLTRIKGRASRVKRKARTRASSYALLQRDFEFLKE